MSDWHCYECDEPIVGGVSQTRCVACLLGIEEEVTPCEKCGDPTEDGHDFCTDCQVELDEYEEGIDERATVAITGDFDAMLAFLHGRESDA